jgi:Ca2+-binding EF-hand superfamily protein
MGGNVLKSNKIPEEQDKTNNTEFCTEQELNSLKIEMKGN